MLKARSSTKDRESMRNECNRVKPCVHPDLLIMSSSEPSGLSFRLKESQDVALSDWTLDVSHKSTLVLSDELNLNLGNSTTGTSFSNDLSNLSKSNFVAIHFSGLLLSK